MAKLIDPRQYFLNIIAKSRLASVQKTEIKLNIDIAKARYENLDISEVVFSNEQFDETTSSWKVDIACKGRGYILEGVKYTSGTLAPMVKANATVAVEDIQAITVPGFYLFNDALYLVGSRGMEISELLAMTGYEFTEQHYTVVEYEQRDLVAQADAMVAIDYSFLKGGFFVSYIQDPKVEEVTEQEEVVENNDTTPKEHDIAQLETDQLQHDVKEEVLPEQEEEMKEKVVEKQQPAVQNYRTKGNRR